MVIPVMSGFAGAALVSGQRMLFGHGPDCAIVRVISGDLIRIHCHETGFDRIKLVGLDAPNIYEPACFGELIAGYKTRWALQVEIWRSRTVQFRFVGDESQSPRPTHLYLDEAEVAKKIVFRRLGLKDWRGRAIDWCS